jgi:hypothetical protein
LRQRLELPLDHGEPVLLAAKRRGVRVRLLAQAGQVLEIRLRLLRQLPDM